jgi:hypothetical protein
MSLRLLKPLYPRKQEERPKLLKVKTDEIEQLAVEYAKLEREVMKLREEHSHVFEAIEDLQTQQEERRLRIQVLARKRAILGKTVNLVNTKLISVQVQGKVSCEQYDYLKAVKYWPSTVLHRVLRVDPKAVAEVIQEGKLLTDRLIQRALLPREAKTPAVTLRVKR